MKIALDIGHAKGTGSRGNGLEEHAVATQITMSLAAMLVKQGHEVTVIDYPDKSNTDDLNATIRAANSGNYDFGVSIHCDCSENAGARGAHVCYISQAGLKLAKCIIGPLAKLLPGRADLTVRRTNLAVLKTDPVWVLVECGFISNAGDAAMMRDHPELIARAIAEGVKAYC